MPFTNIVPLSLMTLLTEQSPAAMTHVETELSPGGNAGS